MALIFAHAYLRNNFVTSIEERKIKVSELFEKRDLSRVGSICVRFFRHEANFLCAEVREMFQHSGSLRIPWKHPRNVEIAAQ